MVEEQCQKVPLFVGKDFGLWKRRVQIALRQKKALAAIEKQEEEGKKGPTQTQEDEAQHVLFSSLGSEVAKKVLACTTAYEIWTRMLQIYENSDQHNVDQMLESYYAYRKESGDDMSTHISKVERMADQLNDVNQKQTEESIMSKLLNSLPETYSSLKEAWRSVHPDLKTRDNLIARLLKYDTPQVNQESLKEVALVANNRASGSKPRQDHQKRLVKCYNCGKMGTHFAKDCRGPPQPRKSGNQGESRNDHNIAMIVGSNKSCSNQWIVDSGASRHISCRREWFSTFKECKEELQVGVVLHYWTHPLPVGNYLDRLPFVRR